MEVDPLVTFLNELQAAFCGGLFVWLLLVFGYDIGSKKR